MLMSILEILVILLLMISKSYFVRVGIIFILYEICNNINYLSGLNKGFFFSNMFFCVRM